ncbi:MAG: hypothetical protein B9S37_08400 [Verrucomicrobiia bacterium Tous-C3TDCM]|jgi:uncharacterized protein (DUF433 family)|nr:MAG: hypothetical protein B9S37_08400 [Verrucomicrobiae bacterium Tous-C3TDCM]PAZ04831.1 MAG: hypothetical protein CAK88_10350 [Verrucomicrobiae bacterium AMD-G2]
MTRHFAGNERISFDPEIMGGKPCIRDLRVTVGSILGNLSGGMSQDRLLELYPYLEKEDISAALEYAAWAVSSHSFDLEVPLAS